MAIDDGDLGFSGTGLHLINNGSGDANNLYSGRAASAGGGPRPGGGIRSAAPSYKAPEITPGNGAQPDNPLIKLLTPAVALGTAAGNPAGGAAAAGGAALLFKYIDKKYGKQIQNWLDPMVPAAGEPAHQLPAIAPQTTAGHMETVPSQFSVSSGLPKQGESEKLQDAIQLPSIGNSAPQSHNAPAGMYFDQSGQLKAIPNTETSWGRGNHAQYLPPGGSLTAPKPQEAPSSIYVSPFTSQYIPEQDLPGAPAYDPKMVRSSQRGYSEGQR